MKGLSTVKYIVVLLISVIFILGISNYSTYHQLRNSLDQVKDYKFKYSLYKDSLGRENAKFKIDPHHINQLNPQDGVVVRDEAKALGIRPEHIKQVTKVATSTTATFHISNDSPLFNDGHLSLNVVKTPNSITGTYTYEDTAWFDTYTKDKRILGIKYGTNTFGNVHFGNPNTHITGLNSITIDKYTRPKHWSIGPTLGVTYTDKVRPYIGFGITYSIIKL